MKTFILVVGAQSLIPAGAAIAQHSGSEQEHRACAGNVQKYCRPVLDQGDFMVCWPAFNNIGQNSTVMCRQVCRITPSDREISASARRQGTNLGIVGSLSAAPFPRIIWSACRPSVIHDRSPFY